MDAPGPAPRAEQERLERDFAAYAADPGKRRAWDAANPGNAAMREQVLTALLPAAHAARVAGRPVLDAGCGTGWWLGRLAEAGTPEGSLHGVDLLEERVAAAAQAVPGAEVAVADIRALPRPDDRFGLVLLLTTLSSLATAGDVRAALAEARRVTAPGGTVVVWEPRIPTPGNRRTRYVGRRDLRTGLGPDVRIRSITLAPPLARRVGPGAYAALSRVPLLRTHRLAVWRKGG